VIIQGNDPFRGASFSLLDRLRRQLWNIVHALLFRWSPRPFHGWRALLLRLFGARMGRGCHVYPGVRIWAPWNLVLGDHVGIADGVTLYSMATITIGSYAVVSQGAHLCCGTHDYNSSNFQLIAKPIAIGAQAWICAEAFVHPGVTIPDGCVVGARSVVTKPLPNAWHVYAGNPCHQVAARSRAGDRRIPHEQP
jgi:putative colanic acid biosynthesis acetyltransferase WcaF